MNENKTRGTQKHIWSIAFYRFFAFRLVLRLCNFIMCEFMFTFKYKIFIWIEVFFCGLIFYNKFRKPFFILIDSYESLENRRFIRFCIYITEDWVLIYDDIMLKMGLYSSGSGFSSMVFLCQCQQWIVSMYLLVNSYFLFNLHTIKRYRKKEKKTVVSVRFFSYFYTSSV